MKEIIRVVVFGVGRFYHNRIDYLQQRDDIKIVGYIDNNQAVVGKQIDGMKIAMPQHIEQLEYDMILLMSVHVEAMKKQLFEMGVVLNKVWTWKMFDAHMKRGSIQLYGETYVHKKSTKVLIITHDLGYHGGSIAATYAAQVLLDKGYHVVLAAPSGDKKFIAEMRDKGMAIIICPSLNYIHEEELMWINIFDVVVVNTFTMVVSAHAISKVKPVLWWLHECSDKFTNNFSSAQSDFYNYSNTYDFSKIHIAAVGKMALENFNYYYPNAVSDTLVYGIPDRYEEYVRNTNFHKKIIFALIGGLCERKAQKIWIEAIKKLEDEEKKKCEFWLIGSIGEDAYSKAVLESARGEQTISVLGQLTREEIEKAYCEIDVVVCPSLEEIVPITITEGLMFEKICVVTNMSSTASYIKDGANGFICEAGNINGLTNIMKRIILNINSLNDMKKKARKTYEEIFSMSKFSDNLEKMILNTMETYDYGCNRESNTK